MITEEKLRELLNELEHLRRQRDELQRCNNEYLERARKAEELVNQCETGAVDGSE